MIVGPGNAWTRLVAEGGLSATAVFQALLTSRIARGAVQASPQSQLINCCFPDVANGIVAAMGLPIACGIGNIAILAHAFAGTLDGTPRPKLQMLCHYQNIAAWRRPRGERSGPLPRVWLDGVEIADTLSRFAAVQLTPEPVIDISGASGVTLMLAMAHRQDWTRSRAGAGRLAWRLSRGPGGRTPRPRPAHRPGSRRRQSRGMTATRRRTGWWSDRDGHARYTGRLYDGLKAQSPDLASGFHVRDLEQVWQAMSALRDRMLARPV